MTKKILVSIAFYASVIASDCVAQDVVALESAEKVFVSAETVYDQSALELISEIDKELELRYIEKFKTRTIPDELRFNNLGESLKSKSSESLIEFKGQLQKSVYCRNKVQYGCDDRIESQTEIVLPTQRALARAATVLVSRSRARQVGDKWELRNTTLRQQEEVCADEPFENQPVPGFCSGFLVSKDVIATAGHCVTEEDISDTIFVFGFSIEEGGDAKLQFSADDVYFGVSVAARKLDQTSGEDWALVKLDREVSKRTPVPLRRQGILGNADEVCVIGHPVGLPQKLACNALPTENDNEIFFLATLDTYGGNSGSMVFNLEQKIVEGILVRGEQDFDYNLEENCRESLVCPEGGGTCSGEGVTRISRVLSALDRLK